MQRFMQSTKQSEAVKQAEMSRQIFEQICNVCKARDDFSTMGRCVGCPTEAVRQQGVTGHMAAISGYALGGCMG